MRLPRGSALRLRRTPSLRLRLLLTFVSLNLLAGAVACAVMIWNAREATRVEMRASLEIAERFVKETVSRFGPSTSGGAMLSNLPLHLNLVRHVRIAILDNAGDLKVMLPDAREAHGDEDDQAPLWFARLLSMSTESRYVPVVAEGRRVGTVVIMGEPGDEAAEVWQDFSTLAVVAVCINILIFILFYFTMGRILNPLTSFSDGLKDLEHGHYRSRLPRPSIREMAAIADRFNALGTALEEARQENGRLYHALIHLQDEERKQIAADLHNEFGQCLFAIKANASSIEALQAGAEPARADVAERARSILSITERLQGLNRSLLKKLRPSAFGHASLAELLDDLMKDFRRHHQGIAFVLNAGPLRRSYGEAIDLSVYRCVQEGLTNSVRHAMAQAIEVRVGDDAIPAQALRIEIRDDGQGLGSADLNGFGLRSMRERVRSLGGDCLIEGAKPIGTRLLITLPHATDSMREEVA